jgi:hypothetical protein
MVVRLDDPKQTVEGDLRHFVVDQDRSMIEIDASPDHRAGHHEIGRGPDDVEVGIRVHAGRNGELPIALSRGFDLFMCLMQLPCMTNSGQPQSQS